MSIEFHRRMLADRVRHDAFRAALEHAIKPGESTVADIGAGTGVLAFFARELGAREVWLYDPGPALTLAETVAARNGIAGLHFVPERSLDVTDPPLVDVVVAEVLGNFAYEEGVLETLRDARRFLVNGGTLVPHSLAQWVAPVTSERFDRDLASWRSVGSASRRSSRSRSAMPWRSTPTCATEKPKRSSACAAASVAGCSTVLTTTCLRAVALAPKAENARPLSA